LIGTFDSEVLAIVALSLRVSLSATIIAMVVGAPLAGALAMIRFPGQQAIVVLVNAMLRVTAGCGWPGDLSSADTLRPTGLCRAPVHPVCHDERQRCSGLVIVTSCEPTAR
jgi:hypothetical protein